jgi:hypothetical protein
VPIDLAFIRGQARAPLRLAGSRVARDMHAAMCCFSGPIQQVSATNLFARAVGERQLLAYGMEVAARKPVAMILPLPVPPGSGEDAVRFVDLSAYPNVFEDLRAGFPAVYVPRELNEQPSRGGGRQQALVVHEVGDFVASFVPRLADFARLDRRFRLADSVWRALPQYADWGFAVFRLKDLGGGWLLRRIRPKKIHPMALEFPRRRRDAGDALYLPTVHVHDGEVHARAEFDHTMYYQADAALRGEFDERAVTQTAERAVGTFVDVARTAGVVDAGAPVHRLIVRGEHPNRDTWLTA